MELETAADFVGSCGFQWLAAQFVQFLQEKVFPTAGLAGCQRLGRGLGDQGGQVLQIRESMIAMDSASWEIRENYGKRVKCWFSRSEACRNRAGPRRQTKMALGNWSTTEEVVPRPLPSIMDLWFWRQLGSTKIDVSCHFSRINKPGRVVR